LSTAAAGRRGYFIAGTDTGVGKTRVACGLILAFRALGRHAAGFKPVMAGEFSDDLDNIAEVSGFIKDFRGHCTYRLSAPVAPNIAADQQGILIDIEAISTDWRRLSDNYDTMLVEGTGGWLCPINELQTMADVALALQLPVVLVVGMRLGCLNHALLTADSIRRSGLRFAGWLANCIDPDFAALEANLVTLRKRLGSAPLTVLPHQPQRAAAMPQLTAAARLLADC
jgi:dethiobiotin synthetase